MYSVTDYMSLVTDLMSLATDLMYSEAFLP